MPRSCEAPPYRCGAAGGFRVGEVNRFHYAPRRAAGRLRWDVARLLGGIHDGLRRAWAAAARDGSAIASVGVDSWGVDYALIDGAGALIEEPVCYRDDRTAGTMERVYAVVPREEIYARTGIQFMPFNTLFQLAAHVRDGLPERAAHLLLVPDFCHHHLCGSLACERTDASTTQLLDARTRAWDGELFARLGLPRALMPEAAIGAEELEALRDFPRLGFPSEVPYVLIGPRSRCRVFSYLLTRYRQIARKPLEISDPEAIDRLGILGGLAIARRAGYLEVRT